MKRMSKFRGLFLFLISLVLVLACRSQVSETVVLNLWLDSNDKEMRFFKHLARQFESENPQYKLRLRFVPFADLKPRYAGEARESGEPDLLYLMSDWVGELAEQKLLLSLTEPNPNSLAFSRESLGYQGKYYAQPFVFQVIALIRNTEYLPQAPKSFAEIQPIQKSEAVFPLMYDNQNFYFHAAFFHAFGGKILDSQGNLALKREPLIQSIRYALSLQKMGLVPAQSSASATLNLFSSGKAALMISGPWALAAPQENHIPLAISALPALEGHRILRPLVGVKGFAVNPWGKSHQHAKVWLDFVARPEVQKQALQDLDNLPVDAKLYQSADIPALKREFYEQAQKGLPMPNSPLMKDVWQELNWLLGQCFKEPEKLEFWVDSALQDLQKKVRHDAYYFH
ncbi:hypothetical protein COW36_13530 [bacterium (Candidatus Blackallbacteria) CG17_big_fil_post_rev_8_21_14_2_50_48_46]|uniref:Maltodextrin-binding protein n=1 Tax=bacterium (Candidatus Blackallbacteria) CG17_big_fil_post_rev_8_21_14_2_50_48_46 TaxID=2014261 RepID=A0A2M7G3D5_9BACT|nr:MAG: hypothetical protein COW64_22150 [bacterium (Candidatus Blackallbacteria) CG18_big_fil_WC_8_21_14_2_50_49_26]PIW16346.1 MAG: hypothetical protein COW36_13530 [bacterium (Candidatus Blackallbacteria) CG17_big_fil_post_rev_8_21_14_2_50_48_46]PIW45360.1 MAG: hypothetical protein COW20_20765 [bacterium (Candidatus Blackallbacteria) CG13_big_fil_rev_8_21_14_2_50_49_14]